MVGHPVGQGNGENDLLFRINCQHITTCVPDIKAYRTLPVLFQGPQGGGEIIP